MIVSIDSEKAFDNIQHPFIFLKTVSKVRIGGTYHNIVKAIYYKCIANIIFNREKLNSIFLKIRSKTKMATFTTFIQHII